MPGPFASLVVENQIPKVVVGIEAAVAGSFLEDAQRQKVILVSQVTREETKRRAAICLKIFRTLRGDLKWGVERINDSLPHFLRCELDGIAWTPDATRASWSPSQEITREDTRT
jgi:hypothetical protein